MCDYRIGYKGGVIDSELVTRVTRLGYEIQPKMAKGGAFFKVERQGYFSGISDTNHIKGVHFEQSALEKGTIFTSCHNSKRV
jgi:hypothetical protein